MCDISLYDIMVKVRIKISCGTQEAKLDSLYALEKNCKHLHMYCEEEKMANVLFLCRNRVRRNRIKLLTAGDLNFY